ncbi:hypothetical protein SAMN05216582_11089 [Selenomonas ruminantium]|uniref:DUF1795 domain-containing protein n=1 Tax=Selenomonas ruminantium TaxID=971 RepID=A0A1M6U4D5_SELRU|nr:hypothetical protein [Selenomonas ruminantium]SHK64142.1 hypothetical protein SAMN05216582_11089 [Selenomonas ruminantium]
MTDLSIYDEDYEFTFRGREYRFCERLFYDDRFSLRLPVSFELMPDSVREIYQPGSQPGQLLLTDEAGQFSFSMMKAEDTLDEEIMARQMELCQFILPKMAAGVYVYEADIIEGRYQQLAYFEYIHDALLERMYNCMFLTGVSGHMVWGTISFSYGNRKLKSLAKEIACSCHDLSIVE